MMIHGNHILIELYGFELYGFIEYGWFLCHIAHTYIYSIIKQTVSDLCFMVEAPDEDIPLSNSECCKAKLGCCEPGLESWLFP